MELPVDGMMFGSDTYGTLLLAESHVSWGRLDQRAVSLGPFLFGIQCQFLSNRTRGVGNIATWQTLTIIVRFA